METHVVNIGVNMRERIHAAIAQTEIYSLEPKKNLEKMKVFCEKAEKEKTDLLVFPEMG